MRTRTTIAVIMALLAASLSTGAQAGAESSTASPLGLACEDRTSPDGVAHRFCTGWVASFDGAPLAVDLTLPPGGPGPHPLVVYRHGVPGEGRAELRSETAARDNPRGDGFNNVAFAGRGYAFLAYDVRGMNDSCGPRHVASDPFGVLDCAGRASWLHLFDPRWEVRDAQTLIGLLVDAGVADPDAIGVHGFSAGGVETWFLALLNDRTMALDGSLSPWTSPAGVPLGIAAASPWATFSAPMYGYAPNGRAVDTGRVELDRLHGPAGVPVAFVTAACALLPAFARLAPPGTDPSADLATWCARALAGDPFDPEVDPIVRRLVEEFTIRSPLGLEPAGRVPILSVQGWRDSIATPMHALMMRNRLLDADPGYPITSFFADIGHVPAVNDEGPLRRANELTLAFFDHHLQGHGKALPAGVVAQPTTCRPGQEPFELARRRWDTLGPRILTFAFDEAHTTASHARHPSSIATEPFITFGAGALRPGQCFDEPAWISAGVPGWEAEVAERFLLAGTPSLRVRFTSTGVDTQLNVRLWEVYDDSSRQALVTRGTYRHDGPPGEVAEVEFQVEPNLWAFEQGNRLRLEILGNDAPAYQANNQPFVVTIDAVELRLPTRAVPRHG
jgi:predicted acyl esterase